MIQILNDILPIVRCQVRDVKGWDSIVINRRKPETVRIFRQISDYRVCLHIFNKCEEKDSLPHPHGWPAAFIILRGSYIQDLGMSPDLISPPIWFSKQILSRAATYDMTNPRLFHRITPREKTYTLAITGPKYDKCHADVRTTAGKNLDALDPRDLDAQLEVFNHLMNGE